MSGNNGQYAIIRAGYVEMQSKMSHQRRTELSEEVLAEVNRLALDSPHALNRRPFVSDDDQKWNRSWRFFAYSYSAAFESLWDVAYARRRGGVLDHPILFLCRHSVELWLKAALESVRQQPPPASHGLGALCSNLMDALTEHNGCQLDDRYSDSVRRLTCALDAHDAKADRFRYPLAPTLDPYKNSSVDLDDLYRAHHLITGFCDAVCSQMELEREA